MRTKKVNRYWCDFCNKAGLSAGAMARHETHCTMNPDRNCRVCTLIDGGNGPDAEGLRALVSILAEAAELEAEYVRFEKNMWHDSDADQSYIYNLGGILREKIATAIPALRKAANDCPACILAALRQAKIPVPVAEGFDFKAEMRVVLDDYNESRRDERYY